MHHRKPKIRRRTALLIVALTISAAVVAGCGGGDETQQAATQGTTAETGNEADRTFLEGMSEHHAGGVELGKLAQERGTNEETKQLGADVEEAQVQEIEQMKSAHQRLFGSELAVEAPEDPQVLALQEADPFDKEFYDVLIPHHQEAIRMARAELADGQDPELKELAQSIVDTQSQEINDMNDWRERYYGAPSPEGGVPDPGEEPEGHSSEGGGDSQ